MPRNQTTRELKDLEVVAGNGLLNRRAFLTGGATLAAAIPPALGVGPGAETRIPMAVAVIGGVFLSTLLTLLVVPAAYSLLSRLERPIKS